MTSTHTCRLLTLAGIGSLLAGSVLAQDAGYFYGGLSVGTSRAKLDESQVAAGQMPAGVISAPGIAIDDRETGFKVFGGYQINRFIGLETGYFSLGKFTFSNPTTPAGTLDSKLNIKGVNFDVVGTIPMTENLSAIGRVGANFARTRGHFTGTGAAAGIDNNSNRRETNYKLGAGLQYAFSQSVMVRAELERYRVNDASNGHGLVNVASVGLVFPFGREPTMSKHAMAAPVYVAPAPIVAAVPPAPVVVQAPPPVVVAVAPPPVIVVPERRRVSYSAESMFGFDKSAVQPEGKAALDTFAKELQGARFDRVTVEGHTDRLGSTAYNQTLSMERAEAVKNYLVAPGGLDAAKISAVGKSEALPVTKPEDCKGTKDSAKLRACLAPDRRVEIEVSGTR